MPVSPRRTTCRPPLSRTSSSDRDGTAGGPIGASEMMATYMYKFGFQRLQIGYGSAVAVIIFLFCLGLSLIYQRASRRSEFA